MAFDITAYVSVYYLISIILHIPDAVGYTTAQVFNYLLSGYGVELI